MKLVCQLRIKDEEKNIKQCLDNLSFVDHFCIVDNGSTDKTLEILKNYDNISIEHTVDRNEGRDKNIGLEMAKKLNPEWILWMDADEIFENKAKEVFINLLDINANSIGFRIFPFVNSKKYYRIDRNWGGFTESHQIRLFKNYPDLYWEDKVTHAGMIKNLSGKIVNSNLRIKHYTIQSTSEAVEKYNMHNLYSKKTLDGRTYEHLIDDVDAVYKKWIE